MPELLVNFLTVLAGVGVSSLLAYVLFPQLLKSKLERDDAETDAIQLQSLGSIVNMLTTLVTSNETRYQATIERYNTRIDVLEKAAAEYRLKISQLETTVATLETLLKQANS